MEKREGVEPSCIAVGNVTDTATMEDGMEILYKARGKKPPYDPAIPFLGVYPKETKIERDMCIPVFTAAQFTIARAWKQPRSPSTDEWIKKLRYIYTMDDYSAT